MPFQLSPGVAVVEKDFTSIVPAVSTSAGAFAGVFQWGPVLDPVTVTSENVLVQRFGKPNDGTAQSFFTAANFLSYSNNLLVSRADVANAKNAVSNPEGSLLATTVVQAGTGFTDVPAITFSPTSTGTAGNATLKAVSATVTTSHAGSGYALNDTVTVNLGSGIEAIFKVTGVNAGAVTSISIQNAGIYTDILAASLSSVVTSSLTGSGTGLWLDIALGIESVVVSGGNYTVAPTVLINGSASTNGASVTATIGSGGYKINNLSAYQSLTLGSIQVGTWAAKYPGSMGNSLEVSYADSLSYSAWAYADEFDSAPGTSTQAAADGGANDELHIIVVDKGGLFTGVKGAVLEKFAYVSKARNNKKSDGTNNYYVDVINNQSRYVWFMRKPTGSDWGGLSDVTYVPVGSNVDQLGGGIDDYSYNDGDLTEAYDVFLNDELYDISLIPVGKASDVVAEHVITNIAEARRDCVAFISPEYATGTLLGTAGDIIIGGGSDAVDAVNEYRNALPSSSYAVLDSGYKYQYDSYNDTYRWVPLNGDIAGLCARTDYTNDPWWSPGGLNRGQIKNVVKLALNPGKTERDNLYKNGVNPVVSFPGQGVVLFGDKTLLAKPSAFDRINVRRLFIVLEKAIAIAAKYQLFEFNDSFTRAMFKSMVEPFLRDVQGRRGIIDFRVKCDDQNNTGEVIDRNEFVADIFIKPSRSINFITLNFIAARTSVSFEEIGA